MSHIELHGPFVPGWRVSLYGYLVPYIDARPVLDGLIDVTIDQRFGMPGPVPLDEFERWLPILANAMAVAAGYSCHGENCQPINLFKMQIGNYAKISTPRLTVLDGGKTIG